MGLEVFKVQNKAQETSLYALLRYSSSLVGQIPTAAKLRIKGPAKKLML